jgi:glycosyltransferase involved in cell wall biosynthesis
MDEWVAGRIDGWVRDMQAADADVTLRTWPHGEQEGLAVLGRMRCAVLPYQRHYGMSRVLVEAAHVGTPVVVQRGGLVGHLVEQWGIGTAVDCRDPRALRAALDAEAAAFDDGSRREALEAFASRFASDRFTDALVGALAL